MYELSETDWTGIFVFIGLFSIEVFLSIIYEGENGIDKDTFGARVMLFLLLCLLMVALIIVKGMM